MDASKLGIVAAALMDDLVSDAEHLGAQELGEVLLMAEVRGEDDGGGYTYIRFRCSDVREWVQRGLLHACLDQDRLPDSEVDDP